MRVSGPAGGLWVHADSANSNATADMMVSLIMALPLSVDPEFEILHGPGRYERNGAILSPALHKRRLLSCRDMPMTSKPDVALAVSDSSRVVSHLLAADGEIPNNGRLPLLFYPGAVRLGRRDPAAVFERLFAANDWVGCWRNGIFPFHHYHSTAHEVLGIYSGSVVARLGGEAGVTLTLNPGDVVIVPAGVGHKKVSSSGTLGVVGAYPSGQQPDVCRPGGGSCQRRSEQVARVFVPPGDPVHGPGGPMCAYWGQ
jgi:uncharacterized protein YjlB